MENIKDMLKKIAAAKDTKALEEIRVAVLGKSGSLTAELKALGALPEAERKKKGAELNKVREEISVAIEAKYKTLAVAEINEKLKSSPLDITLSHVGCAEGCVHPISQVKDELLAIFGAMGFKYADGPDIEDDFHNFLALNFPLEHPARSTQDSFFIANTENLLRTQTSDVQIRAMEKSGAPIKIITMGRVYRRDMDATHTPTFHQIEGLYIGKGVTMAHLKGCLMDFLRTFFEVEDIPVRFRPHYFPFTEPSAEVDMRCSFANGELKIGPDGNRYMEMLGCGMVHPQVLKNVGINPDEYQGFAFGTGIERLAMLKYGVSDMRKMFEPDMRWLRSYGFRALDVPSVPAGLSRK